MATYMRANGFIRRDIDVPLTLTALQIYVGGFIQFIELPSGDVLVVNEVQELAPLNTTATLLTRLPVTGDVILCEPEEIA